MRSSEQSKQSQPAQSTQSAGWGTGDSWLSYLETGLNSLTEVATSAANVTYDVAVRTGEDFALPF